MSPVVAFGVAVRALLWFRAVVGTGLVLAAVAIGVSMCAGCGSALLAQARAAAIATVALEGSRRVIVAAQDERQLACETEECVLTVRADFEPARTTYEGVRSTLSSWVSALDIARLAGAGEELLPAMLTAGMRFVVDWQGFADVLRALGVPLDPLPNFMLADLQVPQ